MIYSYKDVKIPNCHVLQFDSTFEMARESSNSCSYSSVERNGSSFIGRKFTGWDEVCTASEAYWDYGMEVYDRLKRQLGNAEIPPPKNLKRRAVWRDDEGEELDLDRLQRDRPFWRTTMRERRPGPMSATLITEVSTPAYVDSKDILWRGAASVYLTELLEAAGYRIEMWAANHVTNTFLDRSNLLWYVNLKRQQDPIEIVPLINSISGWYFRTIGFGAYRVTGKEPTCGLGSPTKMSQTQISTITPDANTFVCDGVWSFDAAVMWIKNSLERLK